MNSKMFDDPFPPLPFVPREEDYDFQPISSEFEITPAVATWVRRSENLVNAPVLEEYQSSGIITPESDLVPRVPPHKKKGWKVLDVELPSLIEMLHGTTDYHIECFSTAEQGQTNLTLPKIVKSCASSSLPINEKLTLKGSTSEKNKYVSTVDQGQRNKSSPHNGRKSLAEQLPINDKLVHKDSILTPISSRSSSTSCISCSKSSGTVQKDDSDTMFSLICENSQGIENLQSGINVLNNKLSGMSAHKKDNEETIVQLRRELISNRKEIVSNNQKIKNPLQVEEFRNSLQCLICLESPQLPVFACPACSRVIGCLTCVTILTKCPNCRASMPLVKQPLRGLEMLEQIIPQPID